MEWLKKTYISYDCYPFTVQGFSAQFERVCDFNSLIKTGSVSELNFTKIDPVLSLIMRMKPRGSGYGAHAYPNFIEEQVTTYVKAANFLQTFGSNPMQAIKIAPWRHYHFLCLEKRQARPLCNSKINYQSGFLDIETPIMRKKSNRFLYRRSAYKQKGCGMYVMEPGTKSSLARGCSIN